MKHAKEPWAAKGPAVYSGRDCIAVCDMGNAHYKVMSNNAKLMAAAPALLKLVNVLLEGDPPYADAADGVTVFDVWLKQAEAVLKEYEL